MEDEKKENVAKEEQQSDKNKLTDIEREALKEKIVLLKEDIHDMKKGFYRNVLVIRMINRAMLKSNGEINEKAARDKAFHEDTNKQFTVLIGIAMEEIEDAERRLKEK